MDQFNVTLHHLAADGSQAGAQFPELDLTGVTRERLRTLLETLAALAPRCEYPVVPELRIAGPHGRFLVQAKNGQIRVTSWSAKTGAADLTPERIFALITGTEAAPESAESTDVARPVAFGGLSRRWALAILVAAVAATNGATAWLLTRPTPPLPPSLLPPYQLVDVERAKRVLTDFAGLYETGNNDGDRSLTIGSDGRLKWVRFGPKRAVTESHELTAQAAESGGRPVLVASNSGMIEMKDPITLVYFGDIYRRK